MRCRGTCPTLPPKGRTLVIGAGKAAASMALAVEQHWPADAPLDGIVITRYAHGLLTNRISVVEAGHPVPDEAGESRGEKNSRQRQAARPGTICCSRWFPAAARAC